MQQGRAQRPLLWYFHMPKRNETNDKSFYHTSVWQRARKMALQRDHYLCQFCLKKGALKTATEVHHIKPLADYPELSLDLNNLVSLCWQCHEETKKHKSKPAESFPARIIRIRGQGDEDCHSSNMDM